MRLYLISEPVNRCIKIGVASSVARRLRELQTGCAYKLTIEQTFAVPAGQAAHNIETDVHRMLRRHRVSGEWFTVSIADAIAAATFVISGGPPKTTIDPNPYLKTRVTCPKCGRWKAIPILIASSRKLRCIKCRTLILPSR